MGRNDFADILEENLKEEKAAHEKLTKIAESRVNAKASGKVSPARARKRRAATPSRRRTARRKAA